MMARGQARRAIDDDEKTLRPGRQAQQQDAKDAKEDGVMSWRVHETLRAHVDALNQLPRAQRARQDPAKCADDASLGLFYEEGAGSGWDQGGSWWKQSVESAFWRRAMASSEVELVDASVTVGEARREARELSKTG